MVGFTLQAKRQKQKAKNQNKGVMLTNFLCYILLDLFDVFGVIDFFDFYLPFDDPDYFDPFELSES